jgi:hypothetical protein
MKMDALFEQDYLPAEENRRREIAKTRAVMDAQSAAARRARLARRPNKN